jgi:hypothetical protein
MRRKTYFERSLAELVKEFPTLQSAAPVEQARFAHKLLSDLVRKMQTQPAFQEMAKEALHDVMFNREMFGSYLDGQPIYKIADNFGLHLDRAKLDIKCEDLPCKSGEFFNIELPDTIQFTNGQGDYFRSILVSIGEYDPKLKHDWRIVTHAAYYQREYGRTNPRMLCLLAPDCDEQGRLKMRSSYTIYPIPDGMTLGEALEHHVGDKVIVGRHLAQFAGKCLVYLKSDNPELKKEAGRTLTTKKEKKRRAFEREHCPFDVTHVGYGFHNRVFHVDETGVVGHFRTYHTGPGRVVPVTRWIDEHVRHFNQAVTEAVCAKEVLPRPGVEARP